MYLTEARISSHKQYLDDCRNGVDTVKAWTDHKARMKEAESRTI